MALIICALLAPLFGWMVFRHLRDLRRSRNKAEARAEELEEHFRKIVRQEQARRRGDADHG